MKLLCSSLLLVLLMNFSVSAQNPVQLTTIIPREKVYLSIDKTFYIAGDSIAIDATAADARTMENDTLSVPLYVELTDPNKGILLNRWVVPLTHSKAKFRIKIPKDYQTNYYSLRAYTNWMRNFGVESFAKVDFPIFSLNYQNSVPNTPITTAASSIEVSPEGGTPVIGLVSNLYVVTKDAFQKGVKSWVTLRADTTAVKVFDTDENGQALVEFLPERGKKYSLEAGDFKTDISVKDGQGVVLRGFLSDNAKKMTMIIQQNFSKPTSFKMLLQCRGELHKAFLIESKEKITVMNFETNKLPEGILNVAIIDSAQQLLCERVFGIAHTDKDASQNHFLFNSELDEPIKSTRFRKDIRSINVELIARKNVLYDFKNNYSAKYANELGITIRGKIAKKESEKLKGVASVSLIILPSENDSQQKKQMFNTFADGNGYFQFDDLQFYGKPDLNIFATVNKRKLAVEILKDSIPTIPIRKLTIDWRDFITPTQTINLTQESQKVSEKLLKWESLASKELDEVTVTTKKVLKSPISILGAEPSARFLPAKLMSSGVNNTFADFFNNNIRFRLTKHLTAVVKYFIDDFLSEESDALSLTNDMIAYVDVHDGTADSNMMNASILINIYTKGYYLNPMVGKVLGEDPKKTQVKFEGYYAQN